MVNDIPSLFGLDYVNAMVEAIAVEVARLGWSQYKAAEFLNQHFGKRSRWLLDDGELAAALKLFKQQPDMSSTDGGNVHHC